ncbi:3-phosphoshikimate 1-carboxyvinyltransferase [Aminipila butyrica]|uniref:3-phosphoshikimate 1-carboxyvinyltransferase n=1 Tax=Aminipila butyrica TaxID=433296 RepID=A0A858BSJ5_9FIRM|nr:3-phosphoshikimate 1-carboxyvinyltransferase [Aminipila butyrica]QIB68048.1 3-phosphoshikimate 1-carboxyvinyltransferase [Aminipila butyrica]
MNILIQPTPLKGRLTAISSKSHAHRLMLAAALCLEPCSVQISHMNEDLTATQHCLEQLKHSLPLLDCHESGSTLRFLLPVAMALKTQAVFLGSGRLPQRPLSPLKEQMENHGCSFIAEDKLGVSLHSTAQHIFTVKGPLQAGRFHLPGNISSQYITGLLFALPLLKGDSIIQLTSRLESLGYVLLTLEVLTLFGIEIQVFCEGQSASKSANQGLDNLTAQAISILQASPTEENFSFHIKGNQGYHSPGEVTAEGDWSNAAFWLVADALSAQSCPSIGSAVICESLNAQSAQGDKEILAFIQQVTQAKSGQLLTFDVSNVPDLVPILAVLAASRQGITEITNAGRLRIKESDRLATVRELLENLGGQVQELPEGLIISGTGTLRGGTTDGHNDHRIVMAAAIASILCTQPVTITGAEAVNKSYPAFFTDFTQLGGLCHEC